MRKELYNSNRKKNGMHLLWLSMANIILTQFHFWGELFLSTPVNKTFLLRHTFNERTIFLSLYVSVNFSFSDCLSKEPNKILLDNSFQYPCKMQF